MLHFFHVYWIRILGGFLSLFAADPLMFGEGRDESVLFSLMDVPEDLFCFPEKLQGITQLLPLCFPVSSPQEGEDAEGEDPWPPLKDPLFVAIPPEPLKDKHRI